MFNFVGFWSVLQMEKSENFAACEFSQDAKIRNLHCSGCEDWICVHCSVFCHFVIYIYIYIYINYCFFIFQKKKS